jgi:cation-transporting ATPase E
LKVISGDNPITVMKTCKNAGLKNCDKFISMENVKLEEISEICEVYSIFGRTSPDQKQEIIRCLQAKGRVVGYIGDGVNDTQSLRQADCSIALKSGADSTKAVSDVVLLDDDFGHLPSVLEVGRRVVCNIERSMLLFLTKGLFLGLFSLISVFVPGGLLIEIESMYVYEITIIGLAGTLLAFQKNQSRPHDANFVSEVILKSLISGIFMTLTAFIPMIFASWIEMPNYTDLIPIFITIAGVAILFDICRPFSKYTIVVFSLATALSIFLFLLHPSFFCNPNYLKTAGGIGDQLELFAQSFFDLKIYSEMNVAEIVLMIVYFISAYWIYFSIKEIINFIYKSISKAFHKKKTAKDREEN